MGTGASTVQQNREKGTSNENSGKMAAKRHSEIEKQLAKDAVEDSQRVKLLLLGGGESGKSTFAKQMRILHLNGFSEKETLAYKTVVYGNIATSLNQLLDAVHCLKIPEEDLNEHDADTLRVSTNLGHGHFDMTPAMGTIMKRIWYSSAVQHAYSRKTEFHLLDSAKYFLEGIDRISAEDYVPTADDILRSRVATTGIYEMAFRFRNKEFRLVDVGGQRTERRKWIHCFDNVTCVMFVSSLIEYDMVLTEDHTVNRLDDSLALFGFITKNRFFAKASVLLFLNKKDMLREKVQTSPFTRWCPNYTGENTYEAVRKRILDEFIKRKPDDKQLYSYYTTATDTNNVDVVFSASMDMILAKALSSVGFT